MWLAVLWDAEAAERLAEDGGCKSFKRLGHGAEDDVMSDYQRYC